MEAAGIHPSIHCNPLKAPPSRAVLDAAALREAGGFVMSDDGWGWGVQGGPRSLVMNLVKLARDLTRPISPKR